MTTRTTKSPPGAAASYLKKGQRFAELMDHAMGTGNWDGVGLVGVHAAISAADAVCSHTIQRHSTSQNHQDAATLLGSLDIPGAKDKEDLLEAIIAHKSAAAYDNRPFGEAEAIVLAKRVHRFLDWARAQVASKRPPQ